MRIAVRCAWATCKKTGYAQQPGHLHHPAGWSICQHSIGPSPYPSSFARGAGPNPQRHQVTLTAESGSWATHPTGCEGTVVARNCRSLEQVADNLLRGAERPPTCKSHRPVSDTCLKIGAKMPVNPDHKI